jgi:hypothetical protein
LNGELVWIREGLGKPMKAQKIGKSTKGRDALQPFLERVVTWLVENYETAPGGLRPGGLQEVAGYYLQYGRV